MVEVKVIEAFRDREADLELRKVDEVLTVSEDRANKLIGLGLVKLVEEPTEELAEEVLPEPKTSNATPKKRSTKAKQ